MFLLVVLRVSQGKVGRVSQKQLTMTRCTFPHLTVPWRSILALPQVGKFLDMINQVRGWKTSGCDGNLAPTGVMSKGFGGCIYVSCRCDGCGSGGAYFETYMNQPGRTKDIVSKCVQVAFIVAGSTHIGYYKTLKHALGIGVVGPNAFMDTIRNMYPIVKSMLFEICEAAKLRTIVRWR